MHLDAEESDEVDQFIDGLLTHKKLSWGDWSKALTIAVIENAKYADRLIIPELNHACRALTQRNTFTRLVELRNRVCHPDSGSFLNRSILEPEFNQLNTILMTLSNLLKFHKHYSLIHLEEEPRRVSSPPIYEFIVQQGRDFERVTIKSKQLWGVEDVLTGKYQLLAKSEVAPIA